MDFDAAALGPKMQACSDRERKFVWHYILLGGQYGHATEAARQAGYVDGDGTKVTAHRIMQRPRVIDAIGEVARKSFHGLAAPAVAAARTLLEWPDHPDHARVVLSMLSRLGMAERSGVDLHVSGEVTLNHTDQALEQLRALKQLGVPREKLIEAFGWSGLEQYEGMLASMEARPKLLELEADHGGHDQGGGGGGVPAAGSAKAEATADGPAAGGQKP